jgi:hypothetical protein
MSIALESKQATEETRVLSIWMNQWTACKIPFVLDQLINPTVHVSMKILG